MLKKILSWMIFCGVTTASMAGGGNRVDQYTDDWGGGTYSACKDNAIENTDACIGQSRNNDCAAWDDGSKSRHPDYTHGFLMLVAHRVTATGAMFCPTQVDTNNRDHGDSWTEYFDLTNGNDSACVWLCKDGYTGPTCDTPVASADGSCLINTIGLDTYKDYKYTTTGNNIEDSVAMFAWNKYHGCGLNKGQEHDVILAITRWTAGGHGAFARQMVVRADRQGWSDMKSAALVYPAENSRDILVCQDGYRANATITDCQPIDSTNCTETFALSKMCNGWSTGYDSSNHAFLYNKTNDCYQYRCKEAGYGFPVQARNCVACPVVNMRSGVNPETGECMTCELGQVFSSTTTPTYCATALGLSKTDLQYGKGKTKNTNPKSNCQCWTVTTPDEYKSCVLDQENYCK